MELLEVRNSHDHQEVTQHREDHRRPQDEVEGDADSDRVDRPHTRAIPVAELRLHRPVWGG